MFGVVTRAWSAQEDRLLGQHSDKEVARLLNRPFSSIRIRRYKLRIPLANPRSRPWSSEEDALLGTMTDYTAGGED